MSTEGLTRKLTAILSMDVKGYSRLMGEDEVWTVRQITAHRELVTSLVKHHRGRIVDSPGDNILCEFPSVVDAVQCAIEIQQVIKARNAQVPKDRRMQFRMGINLGDVIEEEERLYGDGVNIAARLESLAEPGGICVSGTVYEHIKNKLTLWDEYLGEHSVKNILDPVKVYRIHTEGREEAEVVPGKRVTLKGWQWALVGLGAVIIIGGGAYGINNIISRPSTPPTEVVSIGDSTLGATDEPAQVAVVPTTGVPESTITQTVNTPEATGTSTPTESPAPSLTPTRAQLPTPVIDNMGIAMVFVSAGSFEMGSEQTDESPIHTVYLDAYYIDQFEVTNEQFAAFLNDQGNQTEGGASWLDIFNEGVSIHLSGEEWRTDVGHEDHPVSLVTWYGAYAYCEWRGTRLPTEAEWEKAARGREGYTYPWGNVFESSFVNADDETIINSDTIQCSVSGCDGYDRTAPVGSFPNGASTYGAYDMAGNILEWVADYYGVNYYAVSPSEDPEGPASGQFRILRGGSWYYGISNLRTTYRGFRHPINTDIFIGFRCASTTVP